MGNNYEHHFDIVSIILHWVMALGIFFLFGLGLYMVELTYYDPWYRSSTALHKSIGLGVFMLLWIRVVWRLKVRISLVTTASHLNQKTIEDKLAGMMHLILYVLIVCICFSGYLIATAGERNADFFSLITLPPLPLQIENQEDLAGAWHFYLAWALIIMVLCHALAALKHHYINKDTILINMLRPSKIKKEDR